MFLDMLQKWYEMVESEWLFPGKEDKPLARNTFHMALKKAAEKAGIKKRVYPHLLRHLRATELYKNLNELEMQFIFGWNSSKMLPIYAHLSNEDAIRKILAIQRGERIEIKEEQPKPLKCPRCGFQNNPLAKFCSQCGFVLSEDIRVNIVSYEAKIQELDRLMSEVKELLSKVKEKYF